MEKHKIEVINNNIKHKQNLKECLEWLEEEINNSQKTADGYIVIRNPKKVKYTLGKLLGITDNIE